MNQIGEVTKQLISALQPLADKIGQGSIAVYQMAIKDAIISGYMDLASCLFFVLCLPVIFYLGKKEDENTGDPMLSVTVGIVCLGLAVACLDHAVHNIFNPQYMALKDLLSAVKK